MKKFILFKRQVEDILEEIALLQEKIQKTKPYRVYI